MCRLVKLISYLPVSIFSYLLLSSIGLFVCFSPYSVKIYYVHWLILCFDCCLFTVILCWTDCLSPRLSPYNVSICSLSCLTAPILGYLLSSSVGLTVRLLLCLHTMYQHVHFTVLLSPSLVTYCHHLLYQLSVWLSVCICLTAPMLGYLLSSVALSPSLVTYCHHLLDWLSVCFSVCIQCINMFTSLSYCPHPWSLTVIICCTNCLSDYLSASVLLPPSLVTYCHHLLHQLSVWLSVCICLTAPILGYLLSSSVALAVNLVVCLHTMYQHVHFTVLLSLFLVTYCHHLLLWLSVCFSVCIQCTNMLTLLSYTPHDHAFKSGFHITVSVVRRTNGLFTWQPLPFRVTFVTQLSTKNCVLNAKTLLCSWKRNKIIHVVSTISFLFNFVQLLRASSESGFEYKHAALCWSWMLLRVPLKRKVVILIGSFWICGIFENKLYC